MDSTWNKLYKDYIKCDFKDWDEYFKIKIKLKKNFIKLILKYLDEQKPILECGCGTGKTSIYLSSLGINTYTMDIEDAMIKETKKRSRKIHPSNLVNVFKGDIRKIPYKDKFFSVTHSSGVLEHYSDEEIINIINIFDK